MKSKFSGKTRVTKGADLRYVVTFKLPDSTTESYLIHSPSRLFKGTPILGHVYSISRWPEEGRWILSVH